MSRNEVDSEEINEYIKEYLKYWDLNNSLESFEEEIKSKVNLSLDQENNSLKKNSRQIADTKL